ncbi:MAG: glycerol kinase GlpK [Bdellovibrionaceae bacterium]|nr:glycerol kinase GlpK [Pseudobdellovibrionaceae bacterium]
MSLILVIDQGTTATQVSLVNQKGELIGQHDSEFSQIFPEPGWVEHDPLQIWQTVVHGIQMVLQKTQKNASEISCIGITNQRETTVAWDRHGNPLYHAIVWQCRRTAERCRKLNPKKKWINQKTGLVNDPYFSATKMEWLLKNSPKVKQAKKEGALHFGTIDSFLIYRLTSGKSFVTDVTNASRTMLMNLRTCNWDKDLLQLFGIKEEWLPRILPSQGLFGVTYGLEVLPDGIPITGVLGDQQAALFGQLCHHVGEAKITFGTGSFILVNSGSKPIWSQYGLLSTVAWQLGHQVPPTYAIEGGAFICGAAVTWVKEQLGWIRSSAEIETKAKEVPNTGGVTFIPALSGLGAPFWDSQVRGTFLGLTRGTQVSHLCRAILEALAHQNVDILDAMEKDLRKRITTIKVDGGASQNNLLMQLQADFSGIKVVRPKQVETTTLGAAFMAGLGQGIWSSLKELSSVWKTEQQFEPQLKSKNVAQSRKEWLRTIQAVRKCYSFK